MLPLSRQIRENPLKGNHVAMKLELVGAKMVPGACTAVLSSSYAKERELAQYGRN
jgi:hypothetical protein